MLREVLLFNLILCPIVVPKRRHKENEDSVADGNLITQLRDDKNLDLSMDEEYEDLRAELLAYHTALASLAGPQAEGAAAGAEGAEGGDAGDPAPPDVPSARRSMKTTPCWKLGGICVKDSLCKDTRFLTEVAGCKNNREVCCFTWNAFQTRDLRDQGIGNNAFPWSRKEKLGGKGLIGTYDKLESSHESGLPVYNIPVQLSSFTDEQIKNKKHHHSKRKRSPILVIVKPNKS